MLDFTLNTLGAADAPVADGAAASTGNDASAGATGDSFARALADFASDGDDASDADANADSAETLGDPTRVVDVAGLPFLPDTRFADVTLAASGAAGQVSASDEPGAVQADAEAADVWAAVQASPAMQLLAKVRAAAAGPAAADPRTAGAPDAVSSAKTFAVDGAEVTAAEQAETPVAPTVPAALSETADSGPAAPALPVAAGGARPVTSQNSTVQGGATSDAVPSDVQRTQTEVLQAALHAASQSAAEDGSTAAVSTPAATVPARQAGFPATGNVTKPGVEDAQAAQIAQADGAEATLPDRVLSKATAVETPTETRATSQSDLPAPYYARTFAASATESGSHQSGSGSSSHGQTAFAFSGGQHAATFAPALKFAGASFASALANAPTDDVLPAQTATQIVQSLKLQWARGGGEAEIRLEPRHFGELRIALKVEEGRVNARLEAEAPVVREWLQSNQATLRHSLADQNLTLEHLEVVEPRDTPDTDRRDRQSGRDAQSKSRQGRRRRNEGGELFDVVA